MRDKWRRWFLWLAALVVVVFLAGFSAFVVVTIPRLRLQRELSRLKASGAPLTMAEVAPPPVPDEKNAAVLYQQAFAFLPEDEDAVRIADFASPDPKTRATVSVKDIQRIVAERQQALALLEEAASRPACRFPVNWEHGYHALLPHLSAVRHFSRFLAAKAVTDAMDGHTSEAFDGVALILRMTDHVSAEPSLISQLVRIVCQFMAVDALNRVVEINPPETPHAYHMYKALRRVDNMAPFTHAIEGERCAGLLAFDWIESNPLFGLGPLPGTPNHPRLENWSARARFLVSLPSFREDEILFLRLSEESVALSRQPFRQIRHRIPALDDASKRFDRYAVFRNISSGSPLGLAQSRDIAIALIGLAQHGMALEAYREAAGDYPASLAELRKKVDWPLPKDPFSGRPFIYRRIGNGYIIYSIGPNMKDEGGKDRRSVRGPLAKGQEPPDDIPWRITR